MRKNRRDLLKLGAATLGAYGVQIQGGAFARGARDNAPLAQGIDWRHARDFAGKVDPFITTENRRTAVAPKLRALCTNQNAVVSALEFAQENDLPFSIRSGGHCFEGLSQNSELIIDLRTMKTVEIDSSARQISVQAGATLGHINRSTTTQNLVLPAGFCQSVGIGGHVGGGGMGFLSRGYGLTCDHLIGATLVMAGGQVLDVSAQNHPDLLWALQGGGSGSFGIVTRFKFQTQRIPKVTLVEMLWELTPKQGAELTARWQVWAAGLAPKIGTALFVQNHAKDRLLFRVLMLSAAAENTTRSAAATLFSFADTVNSPRVYQGTYAEVADVIWPESLPGRKSLKIASDFLAAPVSAKVWQGSFARMMAANQNRQSLILDALGAAVGEVAPDKTAFPHRLKAGFLVQYDASTVRPEEADDNIADMRDIQKSLAAHVTQGAYANYPDRDLKNWPRAYWGDNLERLQDIKRRYDPGNVFSHAQSIPLQ